MFAAGGRVNKSATWPTRYFPPTSANPSHIHMSIGDVEVVTTLDGAVRPPTAPAPALAAAAAPGTGHPCNKFIFKLLIEYYLLNLQALNVNVSGGCPTQGAWPVGGECECESSFYFCYLLV